MTPTCCQAIRSARIRPGTVASVSRWAGSGAGTFWWAQVPGPVRAMLVIVRGVLIQDHGAGSNPGTAPGPTQRGCGRRGGGASPWRTRYTPG